MIRMLLTAIAASLLAIPAIAQTAEIQKQINDKLATLRTEDEQLKLILSQHPDVLVAQSKVQTAEATLAQVKLQLTLRVSKLNSEIKAQEAVVNLHRLELEKVKQAFTKQAVPKGEIQEAEARVVAAEAVLAQLKSELKGMSASAIGSRTTQPKSLNEESTDGNAQKLSNYFSRKNMTNVGSSLPHRRIWGSVDVSLEMNVDNAPVVEFLERLRLAYQLGGVVRMPVLKAPPDFLKPEKTTITLHAKMTFCAWVELALDEINSRVGTRTELLHDAYVREYGLLIAPRSQAPKDAITVSELLRIVRSDQSDNSSK